MANPEDARNASPLWVDAFRPRRLSELTFHTQQAENMAKIVKAGDFPHLLIYGPSGAGKKTRIQCILHELYGSGASKLRLDTKSFTTPSGRKLEVQTVSSNYHVQLCPGDVGIYDRVVVQEMIKQMAQMQQIDSAAQRPFKVVVLMEVDSLTRDAQHALRRTMEKYSAQCRLILCCESFTKVIDPLRSRCMALRIAAPSDDQISAAMENVCNKCHFTLNEKLRKSILEKSHGNLRRALLSLQMAKREKYPFDANAVAPDTPWECYLQKTVQIILQEQTTDNFLKVRGRLYECLSRCIPATVIFVTLLRNILDYCDGAIKAEVVAEAAKFEHMLTRGSKEIFYLEAFIGSVMDIYQKHLSVAMEM